MRIQRQVVGKQADVVRQQALQALLHPAGNASVLPAPEQAVVDKNGIGLLGNGRIDQRPAGGHAADDARNLRLALHLQAVGAVIFEAFGLQQCIERLQQGVSGNAHARYCRADGFAQPVCHPAWRRQLRDNGALP